MVTYLLDTHVLGWWLYFPEIFPAKVWDALSDPTARVFVSPVSAYEMSLKYHRGKWTEIAPLVQAFDEVIAAEGFELLPLNATHAVKAGAFGREHRDPFDRMLAAQAIVEGLSLVSKDRGLRELGVEVVWG